MFDQNLLERKLRDSNHSDEDNDQGVRGARIAGSDKDTRCDFVFNGITEHKQTGNRDAEIERALLYH